VESSVFWIKSDQNEFIFSLVNNEPYPMKVKITSPQHAISCKSSHGSTFGCGFDIFIADFSHMNHRSYSNFGRSYQHSTYASGSSKAQSILSGSYTLKVSKKFNNSVLEINF
jgi:hypothetical protein